LGGGSLVKPNPQYKADVAAQAQAATMAGLFKSCPVCKTPGKNKNKKHDPTDPNCTARAKYVLAGGGSTPAAGGAGAAAGGAGAAGGGALGFVPPLSLAVPMPRKVANHLKVTAAAEFKAAKIKKVGRCRLTVSKPVLKARLVSALETKM
jgi:hypothetical protein